MGVGYLWTWIVSLVASCASFTASMCLLWWLHSLRFDTRHKLMWRQLRTMASADALYTFFTVIVFSIGVLSTHEVAVFSSRTRMLDDACKVLTLGYSIGFYSSMLVEVHLAVSCAAAIFRWVWLLRALRACLVLVWPLALTLAFLDVLLVENDWLSGVGCADRTADMVAVASTGLCTLVTLLAYVCSLLRAFTAGQAVRHRIWHRAQYYLLALLVCTLPDLVRVEDMQSLLERLTVLHLLALVLFNLRPLANTLVYAVQSRYLRRMRWLPRQPTASPSKREPLSFHVGLGTVDVVHVVPMSAAAMEESERETAVLEAASRPEGASRPEAETADAGTDDMLLGCFEVPRSPADAHEGSEWAPCAQRRQTG